MIGRNWWVAAVLGLGATAEARAGFISVSLAVGAPGASASSSERTLAVGAPGGNALVIDRVLGAGTVVAGTAGGRVYFGASAAPVLVPLGTGRAYLASAAAPRELTDGAGGLATASPRTGGYTSPNSAHLGVTVLDGNRLSVSVTGVGVEELLIPPGGWWVLGLGPDAPTDPGNQPSGGGPIVPPPVPPPTAATPEPTALALVVIGTAAVAWRCRRRPGNRTCDGN